VFSSGDGPLILVGIFPLKFAFPICDKLVRFQNLGIWKRNYKKWQQPFVLVAGLIRKCCSIFLGHSHLSMTSQFGIMESTHSLHLLEVNDFLFCPCNNY